MGSLLSIFDKKDWSLTDPQTILITVATLVGLYVLQCLISKLTGPKLPPSPMPLPIIGNLTQLAARPKHAHITFNELAQKYGDIYMVKVLGLPIVFLNTVELVKEAFHKHAADFSNRPINYLVSYVTDGGKGIVWHKGDGWRPVRRFMLHALRDFGFGKKSMEGKIIEEAEALGKVFMEHRGKPFKPSQIIREAASNVICSVCFGSRFEYTDEVFKNLIDMIDKNMSSVGFLEPIDFIPLLQYLPFPARISEAVDNLDKINDFLTTQIEEHRASFDKNNLRDFIDIYIEKQAEDQKDDVVFNELNMRYMIRDLFFAGSETTATSIRWSLLHLILYPEIQKRLSKEIEEVVGNGRLPDVSDKANLNHLHAFTMEIFRCCSIAPLNLPHVCEKDTEIGGFTIPKGANVMANTYTIHKSEKYWDKPNEFRPERFLDSNGKTITNKEGFMAFGTGARQCLGESMARTQVFLVLAYLIQNFTFKMVDEKNPPSTDGTLGVTLAPEDYEFIVTPK